MAKFQVNTLKVNNYDPEAIHSIAYNNETEQIALSRKGGNIEVWNAKKNLFKQMDLVGLHEETISGLAWSQNDLFGAGHAGFLYQYDLVDKKVKKKVPVTGGAVMCLSGATHGAYLATGTFDGVISIFEIINGDVSYHNSHRTKKGKIMSIAWHPKKDTLVTGSLDFVHVFSLSTKKSLDFNVGRDKSDKETVIWCIALLEDMTIVVGDSRGLVSFFDGNTGNEIQRIKTHVADILCMTVVGKNNAIWCSGIDPVMYKVQLTGHGPNAKWIKTSSRCHHTHTVRAIVETKHCLISGGDDTHLIESFHTPKIYSRVHIATPPAGYVSVSKASRTVLFGFPNFIEMWRLGKAVSSIEPKWKLIPLSEDAVKLALLDMKTKSVLRLCSISPMADVVCYSSTLQPLRCLRVKLQNNGGISIVKISVMAEDLGLLQKIEWLNDTSFIVLASQGIVKVFKVEEDSVSQTDSWVISKYPCTLLTVSDDGKYVAYADMENRIHVKNMVSKTEIELPKSVFPPTCISFSPFSNSILSCDSNTSLYEFNLTKSAFTEFSRALMASSIAKKLSNSCTTPKNCFYTESGEIYVATSEELVRIKPPGGTNDKPLNKKKKRIPSSEDGKEILLPEIKKLELSGRQLYFGQLSRGALSIEQDIAEFEMKLPMALDKKVFGV